MASVIDTISGASLRSVLPVALPPFEPSCVWLVGTGPGDPGLLTLLAASALAEADVILRDALVGDEIMALARPDAIVEDVGKRGGRPSPKQEAINDRLIHWARAGKRVLRLKGGDPFVFGRGGEECLALSEAGIRFRVVPGISAGIGGLAYAGVPVTHRGLGTSVTLITGHGREGTLPADVDWEALTRMPGALVFFMGLGTLPDIARSLMDAGKAVTTPVAIVSNATTARQTTIETTLAKAARDVARLNAKPPAIIAIGDVVRLRGAFGDWLLNRAIEGGEATMKLAG